MKKKKISLTKDQFIKYCFVAAIVLALAGVVGLVSDIKLLKYCFGLLVVLGMWATTSLKQETFINDGLLRLPDAALDCLNKDYRVIVTEMRMAGFTNIHMYVKRDLDPKDSSAVEYVESFEIDGRSTFTKGERLDKLANVDVIFHSYME